MVEYECKKCGKIFKQKCHYIDHTEKKKKPCDKENTELFVHTNPHKITENTQNPHKIIENTQNIHIIKSDTINDENNKNKYSCSKCNKVFSRNDSLKRHINKYCKKIDVDLNNVKIDDETKKILNNILTLLNIVIKETNKEKINNIMNSNNTNTNSNNTINNQTNINILAHGTTEFNNIELADKLKYLSIFPLRNIIPDFAKHIYLNDSKPEKQEFLYY